MNAATASERPHYRGVDRRHRALGKQGSTSRTSLVVGLALVAIAVLATAGNGLALGEADVVEVDLLRALLEAAAAAVAGVVGILCILRWRLVGEAASMLLGIGLLWYGSATIAAATLLPMVVPEQGLVGWVEWLRASSRLVAIALFGAALVAAPVDTRLRLPQVTLAAIVVTTVLAAVFRFAPTVALVFSSGLDELPRREGLLVGPAVLTAAWAGLAIACFRRGQREQRVFFGWFGLAFLALALAETNRAVLLDTGEVWAAGASILRVAGLACGMVGATMELHHAYASQSTRLLQSLMKTVTAEAQVRAGQLESEERAHEVRNALTGLAGTTRTLERFRDQLDSATRKQLADAVASEVERIQRLVSKEAGQQATEFRLAETLAPVVTAARAQGTTIDADIPSDLVAYGRWADVAQVVQNLLENARRYAPGSPVTLRARREADRVILRTEDRGPGVPREEQRAIFQRGARGNATREITDGSGLGLYVSARLMRTLGGDLWVEDRPGGGASFALSLPASAESQKAGSRAFADVMADQRQDAVQGNDAQLLPPVSRFHEPGTAVDGVREADDDIGGHSGG